MNHEFFKDRISAYFDRELKPEEERMIAEHLAECAECRQLLAEFEKFDSMVEKQSGLKDDLYWEQAAQKIEQAIEPVSVTEVTDIKPSAWKGLRWKLAGVAAAAVALAFISLYQSDILRQLQPDEGVRMQTITPPHDTVGEEQTSKSITEADYAAEPSDAPTAAQAFSPPPPTKDDGKLEAGRDELDKPTEEMKKTVSQKNKPMEADSFAKQADETVAPEVRPPLSSPMVDRWKPGSDTIAMTKEIAAVPESATAMVPAAPTLRESTIADVSGTDKITNKAGDVFVRGTSIQPSDSDLSGELGFSALAEDTMTLADWCDKRDQLWEEAKKSGKSAPAVTPNLTSNMASKPATKEKATRGFSDSQKTLLLCYYNIARLTSDSTEYKASVDSLKSYFTRDDARYAPEARGYLKLLEEDK